ncbi:MAG: isochorismatase family cysteine hydrolase [Steroidobacteraceae bacterium]
MVEFTVEPARLALLTIDLQRCFVSETPLATASGLSLIHRLNPLVALCRRAGILIVHVSHVLRPDGSDAGVLAQIAPVVRQGVIAKGSAAASLHPALDVQQGDVLLDKPRFGAFHGTDLERLLRSRGIDSVVIGGIATSVCCETTAREATVRDFRLFFLSDGTTNAGAGDLSPQEVIQATCATLGRAFGEVLSIDRLSERIRAAAGMAG